MEMRPTDYPKAGEQRDEIQGLHGCLLNVQDAVPSSEIRFLV